MSSNMMHFYGTSCYLDLLNNREQALIIWLVLLFILALSFKSGRRSLFDLVKSLFAKKIFAVLLAMILYIGLVVLLLYRIQFWDVFLTKDTIFWFVGVAFVLLYGYQATQGDEHYFKSILLEALTLIVLLEFVVNLYAFNLWVEIILLPVVSIIVIFGVFAATKEEFAPIGKAIEYLLAAFGLFLIGYAFFKILSNYQNFLTSDNLRAFALPIILTLAYLPFLYLIALYAVYDELFVRLNLFSNKDKELIRLARRKILMLCNVNLKKLNRFAKENTQELMRLRNRNDLLSMIDEFRMAYKKHV